VQRLDDDVRALIAEHGIRNALLTSIAPTGTISLYAGNVSSGIEPVFAYSYTRKVLQPDGTRTEEEVVDYAVRCGASMATRPAGPFRQRPDAGADGSRADAGGGAEMGGQSISKTINVPADIGFEAFKDVYMEAWDTGCKGCTTYRPNDVTGSVLSVRDRVRKPDLWDRAGARGRSRRLASSGNEVVYMSEPLDRPQSLEGHTYKLKWPDSEHALYITINDIMLNGHRGPFEIFINSKNMEHFAWTVALTRMISAVFRRGGDVSFRGRRAQGRVRPARRGLDEGQICAVDPGGHRRRDRAAPDLHRLHRRARGWA
jgi:ribonucleoside-diphosphate reductase alpha chain